MAASERARSDSRMGAKRPSADRQYVKRLGLKLSRELAQKMMSVETLSFETGLARSSLREIIAGRSNPRVITLKKVAEALGYSSLSEFLGDL